MSTLHWVADYISALIRSQPPPASGKRSRHFLICGMPRTGSTLLLASCQKHADIEAYGEIFHEVESERKGRHAIKRPDGQTVYYKGASDDAIEFLARYGPASPRMPRL